MSNQQNDTNNLKDHVEHLRTIHFALVGSCTALLIAVQFLPGIEWRDARNLIKELTTTPLIKNLNNEKIKELEKGVIRDALKCFKDPDIRKYCTNADRPPSMSVPAYPLKDFWHAGGLPAESVEPNIRLEDDGALCCLKFDFGSQSSFVTKVRLEPPIHGFTNPSHIRALQENPKVKDYQTLWNDFLGNNSIQIPWQFHISLDESSASDSPNAARVSVSLASVTDTIRLIRIPTGNRAESIYEATELPSDIDDDLPNPLRLRVKIETKQVNVQPGFWITQDNRYREKHANLIFIASNSDLMNSTFQEAHDHIENEIKTRTESMSVLGLNIPSELLLNWGMVVVVTLQLYLLMHLRSYCKLLRGNAAHEVAWIGYYADHLSKTVFFLTALVLPVITVLILVVQAIRTPNFPYLVPVLALVLVSASISYSTKSSIFAVWKKATI